tara:strand:- start:51 stop:701 length:651 start_codon:yes stop_codon:yes gene_type:complete
MSEIRVENIIGETGVDAVKFTKGINVTGIVTATNVSIGSSVTATSFFGSGAGLSGVSAGKILQVVSVTKTDVFSTSTTGSYVDITGLTVNITPTKANSNILVMAVIGCFVSGDASSIALTTGDGTAIIQGDIVSGKDSVSTGAYAGGNSTGEAWYGNNPAPIFKLHDPSYSLGNTLTYKMRVKGNSGTTYVNRNQSDSSQYAKRTASTITLMEVEV